MISGLSAQFVDAWRSTTATEIAAAGLALIYLVLAIRERIECWAAAVLSSCLYVWVLFGSKLYMESALNAFYAAMAVYGYWQWQRRPTGRALRVSHWPLSRHAGGALAVLAASVLSSYVLRRYTAAAWPFLDSMITWASVFATFLVARKVYENWHWWLVIDSAGLCVYVSRRLYVTTLLFGVYLVLIVFGMRQWRRSLMPRAHGLA